MLPSPHPAVVCKPVAEGAVLLHTESEVYFGLNDVGLQVWDLLPPRCKELAQICAALSLRYPEIEPAQLRNDVSELLQQMMNEGLVLAGA